MEKIVFIEPSPPDFHIFSKMPLPRLGTVLLATILKEQGYRVKSYVECLGEIDLVDVLSADCVGISTITPTAPRSYEIARLLTERGKTVFMGGPHVTFMPDEALEYCDYVLRGEAEGSIVDFIKALAEGRGFDKIPGLSYRVDGQVVHNKAPSLQTDLDSLPIPDFSVISGIESKGRTRLDITPIMTSRGCPFDCSFCSVTSMFGRSFRCNSVKRVIEEINTHRDHGGKWLFFYDDIFNANIRRTKELMNAMIQNGHNTAWSAQVRVEVAQDLELVDLMRRAKAHTVYIGFESVNPATLKAYNKKQSIEDIERCIKVLHKNRIRIHGMFVLGSDEDTTDTIHETVRFAKKNDLESIQFMILTPFPGSGLYREMDRAGRIITRDWSLYDAHHVVFEPMKMSFYELQFETMLATREFYSITEILKRVVRLDLFNVSVKAYARGLSRKWSANNQDFLDYTKAVTEYGRTIELAARKTAEDIKEKLRELEISGALEATISNKSF